MKRIFFIFLFLFFKNRCVKAQNDGLYNQTSPLQKALNLDQLTKQNLPESMLNFSLKLVNVDSKSAQFELIDDNLTTINYAISYTIQMKDNTVNQLTESVVSKKTFDLQTNSIYLLNKQEELLKNKNFSLNNEAQNIDDNGEKGDSGEKYNSEEKIQIKSKPYVDVHRFTVENLESNRLYEINIDITAKLAHLSASLTRDIVKLSNKKYKVTKKSFNFIFQTTFDVDLAAEQACKNAISANKSSIDTCYENNNDCTKCKSTCYINPLNKIDPITKNKPIFCEPCPCDKSKSTGECIVNTLKNQQEKSQVNNYEPPIIKCKQCIEPYTGDQCKDCKNEGIDYYKNEDGVCVKCDCNNNAALDNIQDTSNISKNKRKCSAITGMCFDCMFNTTGKHCNECKIGFKGDPLKRTCQPVKINPPTDHINKISANKTSENTLHIEKEKIGHLSQMALLSLYIFCMLFIILLTYICIVAKSRQNGILKDVQLSSSFCSLTNLFKLSTYSNAFDYLNNATRHQRSRVSFYISSICPFNINKLRTTNLTGGSASGDVHSNCIYTGTNVEEDRLGLAEYQVFDESLINEDSNVYIYNNTNAKKKTNPNGAAFDQFSDNDDVISSGKNPYRSLTIKS